MGNMEEQSPSEFQAEQRAVYLLPLKPISETYIFVRSSGMTDCTKNDWHRAQTIAHHCAQY